jgi:hypothetical protein
MADDGPYRDGLGIVVAQFEDQRARARRSAERLEALGHHHLPAPMLAELRELETSLVRPLEHLDDVTHAEGLLADYEAALNAAIAIAEPRLARHRSLAGRRRLASIASLGALALALWWGWTLRQRHAAYSAACWAPFCEQQGRCHATWSDVLYGRKGDCIAIEDADCQGPCRIWGRCTIVHGECRAGSDEDCAQSERCRDLGECRLHSSPNLQWGGSMGTCAIRTDEDCQQSRACRDEGRCLVGEEACVEFP